VFRPQVPIFLATASITALACWIMIPRFGLTGSAYAVLLGAAFSCAGSAYIVSNVLRSRGSANEA
jgi:O-antigen/teichoic acid export membrane protein